MAGNNTPPTAADHCGIDPRTAAAMGYGALTRRTVILPDRVGSYEVRYLAVAELLDDGQTLTPSELAERIQRRGLTILGRPTKAVSDALRWEVAKGRVRKLGRGRYEVGSMPRSTAWWIRRRARSHYELVAALAADPSAA